MKTYMILLALTALGACVSLGFADIQPGHLVAGPISWNGTFATGEVYVGGTYGQTVKGGRTAYLELQESGKGWTRLTAVVLPDIGPSRYYVTAPLGGPRRIATTIRLRITPSSAFPLKDVSMRTFPASLENALTKQGSISPFEKATMMMKNRPADLTTFQQAPKLREFSKTLPKQP